MRRASALLLCVVCGAAASACTAPTDTPSSTQSPSSGACAKPHACTELATGSAGTLVAVDSNHVYWFTGDDLRAVPLGGGATTTLALSQNPPQGMAIDTSNVYWTGATLANGGVTKLTSK